MRNVIVTIIIALATFFSANAKTIAATKPQVGEGALAVVKRLMPNEKFARVFRFTCEAGFCEKNFIIYPTDLFGLVVENGDTTVTFTRKSMTEVFALNGEHVENQQTASYTQKETPEVKEAKDFLVHPASLTSEPRMVNSFDANTNGILDGKEVLDYMNWYSGGDISWEQFTNALDFAPDATPILKEEIASIDSVSRATELPPSEGIVGDALYLTERLGQIPQALHNAKTLARQIQKNIRYSLSLGKQGDEVTEFQVLLRLLLPQQEVNGTYDERTAANVRFIQKHFALFEDEGTAGTQLWRLFGVGPFKKNPYYGSINNGRPRERKRSSIISSGTSPEPEQHLQPITSLPNE